MIRPLALALVGMSLLAAPVANAMVASTDHPGSVAILLGVDKVRQELKLTSLQLAILDSVRAEYKTAARKLSEPLPSTPEQRKDAEQKLAALNNRYNSRALSVLNDAQRAQFLAIEKKVLGPISIFTPTTQRELGLSADQRSKIESLRLAGLMKVGKINRGYEEGKYGYQERLDKLRKQKSTEGAALLKVLTPAQRASFLGQGGTTSAS